MIPFVDIHTHQLSDDSQVISLVNIPLDSEPQSLCSIGIHPWDTNAFLEDLDNLDGIFSILDFKSRNPSVLAIGEAGLDRLRGADLEMQSTIFLRQIEISEKVRKPMIVHQVKCVEEIVRIHRREKPSQRWIIHGYRNKYDQAQFLIREGMELSFGSFFQDAPLQLAYKMGCLWLETDDQSEQSIQDIYEHAASVLGVTVEKLKLNIYNRASLLLSSFLRV